MGFEISGGREGGFRWYSKKFTITAGKWRVKVETGRGQILGRIEFAVVNSPDSHPTLEIRIIP